MAQAGQKRAGVPVPKRRRTEQALTARGTPAQRRHIRLGPGFIEKNQALRL
jgi:hypothetical protein